MKTYNHILIEDKAHVVAENPFDNINGSLMDFINFQDANPPIVWLGEAFEGVKTEDEIDTDVLQYRFDTLPWQDCTPDMLAYAEFSGRIMTFRGLNYHTRVAARLKSPVSSKEGEDAVSEMDKDVLELCSQVLQLSPIFWDNPNGAYENTCPFCGVTEKTGGNNPYVGMNEIDHEASCAYLIAKDLKTGL